MVFDFFKFYDVYSGHYYNEMMERDINNDLIENEMDVTRSKASQRLIVKDIGMKMMARREKRKNEEQSFEREYAIEKLAYNMFVESMGTMLPKKLEANLKKKGHNVQLRADAYLTYADFERMVKSYMVGRKIYKKPYVLEKSMADLMRGLGGYRFNADDADKAEAYTSAFETACQDLYKEMLYYVSVDYVPESKYASRSNSNKSHVDGCLIG